MLEAPAFSEKNSEKETHMNIVDTATSYLLHTWWALAIVLFIIVLVVYMIVLLVVTIIANYFAGNEGIEWIERTIAKPLVVGTAICENLVKLVVSFITWPWVFRNKRLLKETFGLQHTGAHGGWQTEENQRAIERSLSRRAQTMVNYFKQQEDIRREEPNNKTAQRYANDWVKYAKSSFWRAHALAKKNGFKVQPTYSAYLKN